MVINITHRLVLALRLVDTADGRTIKDKTIVIRKDGIVVKPMIKDDGYFVFSNMERKNFTLELTARGYETYRGEVDFDQLDPVRPLLVLHMVPGQNYRGLYPCLSLEGQASGITAIDAVRAGVDICQIKGWDLANMQITITNPYRVRLESVWYALVDPDSGTYEVFRVIRQISDLVFEIDRVLKTAFQPYFPVCPLIFGSIGPGDRYCLRVADDQDGARVIVRTQCDGQESFETVDLKRSQNESSASLKKRGDDAWRNRL